MTAKQLFCTPGVAEAIDLYSMKGSPPRALGYYLRGKKGRVVMGRKIVQSGTDTVTNSVLWQLVPMRAADLSPETKMPSTRENVPGPGDTGDGSYGASHQNGTVCSQGAAAKVHVQVGGSITGITGTNVATGGVTCPNVPFQTTGDDVTTSAGEKAHCAQCSMPFSPRNEMLGTLFCPECALS